MRVLTSTTVASHGKIICIGVHALCILSGSRYGNVLNELVHRVGPPFLDNQYRDYQYAFRDLMNDYMHKCHSLVHVLLGDFSYHS